MRKERSCGAVVYCEECGKRQYLLLHHPAGHWDFPKGHVNKGETVQACAARERQEETGITDLNFIPGFEEKIHYFFTEKKVLVSKEVVYLLARTNTKEVKLSFEHTSYEWNTYEEALKKVTYQTSAEHSLEAKDFYVAAFLSQQAVEKALKALILKEKKELIKTHNVSRMAKLLSIPEELQIRISELEPVYQATRYPDVTSTIPADQFSEKDTAEFLNTAMEVITWVQEQMK